MTPSYSAKNVSCTVRTDDPTHAAMTYSLAFQTFPRVQFRPLALNLGSLRHADTNASDTSYAADAWLETFRATGEEADGIDQLEAPSGVRVGIGEKVTTDEPAKRVVRTSYPLHMKSEKTNL